MKPCSKCKIHKTLDDFPPRKDVKSGRGYVCRACCSEIRSANNSAVRKRYAEDYDFRRRRRQFYTEWAEKNPEYRKQAKRIFDLGRKGLTPKDYDEMLAQQNDGCWICGGIPSRTPYLHIDHNHETGVVRGLLCEGCNLGLGKFRDDVELLKRAVEYLSRDTGFRVSDSVIHRLQQ
jgi:Recombination endonuclease VII